MTILDIDRPKKASFIKIRFMIVFLATLCPVVCYISRQNLSMAIVAMMKEQELPTSLTQDNHKTSFETCPEPLVVSENGSLEISKIVSYGPKYDWTPSERSLLFETFFITYMVFQIPGARIAEIIGAKWILFTATAGSSILSLLSPWAASQHPYAMATIRALMGICQTAIYPSGYVLYTQWLPPAERSQALPVLGAGAYIGSIIISSATGYFNEQPTLGWPYAFYMPSVVCALWSVLWVFLGASEPREHKLISLEEIDYIESRMEVKKTAIQAEKKQISWMKLVKSRHIWVMLTAFFASNWSFTVTLLLLPTYLNSVLRIPHLKNGGINSIIYVLYVISSPVVGAVSALMVETRSFGLTRLQIRKLFQTIGILSQVVCFIALTFIGCNTTVAIGVLYLQTVFFSFVNGGEVQLPAELSLDFAGTIYAIGNCVGSSTGFIVPRVHSLIVTNNSNMTEWNMFFYVTATITTVCAIVFLLFGKNDLQDFSKNSDNSESPYDIYTMSVGKNGDIEATQTTGKRERKETQITC